MKEIKAAIFDLDGVITQTASIHARAWKQLFDEYNRRRQEQDQDTFRAFSVRDDYPVYIDGKPRYDGIQSFLKSRELSVPFGDPSDSPELETICGLGNLKNRYFQELLEKESVRLVPENIRKLREWRKKGLKTAIISSSKNCRKILEATGIDTLFDTRVDGVISEERGLKGKPQPDIFLEAARELHVSPDETIIIEDALSGVEAGKKGRFHTVIGIAGGEHDEEMKQRGADLLVEDLSDYDPFEQGKTAALKDALDHMDAFREHLKESGLLCLDYDGTLTPIVEDYTKAFLSHKMRELLKSASRYFPIAIVSGRDISFIREQVGLKELYYAGSHGFEIEGPENFHYEVPEARELFPVFDKLEAQLTKQLAGTGARIERKKYALAVHYRKVTEDAFRHVEELLADVLKEHPGLNRGDGKKVIELRPSLDWHKGKAVEVLSRQILEGNEPFKVIYLGDDLTDEDVFCGLKQAGFGILIGPADQQTCADFYLEDVEEVMEFIKHLTVENHD